MENSNIQTACGNIVFEKLPYEETPPDNPKTTTLHTYLGNLLETCDNNCPSIAFDFSDVDIITSFSMSRLLELRKRATDKGNVVFNFNVIPATQGIFSIMGLSDVFVFAENLESVSLILGLRDERLLDMFRDMIEKRTINIFTIGFNSFFLKDLAEISSGIAECKKWIMAYMYFQTGSGADSVPGHDIMQCFSDNPVTGRSLEKLADECVLMADGGCYRINPVSAEANHFSRALASLLCLENNYEKHDVLTAYKKLLWKYRFDLERGIKRSWKDVPIGFVVENT